MILIGVGANLPSPIGLPLETCATALSFLASAGITITRQSHWIKSAPYPLSKQPWFINCVVSVSTILSPEDLLSALHQIETIFGRVRVIQNASRSLDLDLLSYNSMVSKVPPILPHPRLHERAFVALPLEEIAPTWYHPVHRQTITEIASKFLKDNTLSWKLKKLHAFR